MDIIKTARELGKMLQADPRYSAIMKARERNDADEDLQFKLGEFNLKRVDLSREMSKPDKNPERLRDLDVKIKELYGQIMENENMIAFNTAKEAFEELMTQINGIITMCANGADPDTCSPSSCGGGCASCSGCK